MSVTINGIGFEENSNTISDSYTIAANTNALTAGPITVANGTIITISTDATWTIV